MASLKEIREKLLQIEAKRSNTGNGDNSIFPFWNQDHDKTSVVRFLPDADEDNTFFWVEKQVIKIPFKGIKGHDENKQVIVQVPCPEMYGDTCPVHQEIRPWFDDPSLEDLARTYWKKRSYIFQGLVRTDAIGETEAPENPIRRFVMGKQLFTIIKAALLDPDMENIPTDYANGTDFKITKTKSGQHADYNSSSWARKESALTDEELAMLETHQIQNLSDYLPKRPTEAQIGIIFDMFQASVEGELYDPAKWGAHYKPYGFEYNAPSSSAPEAAPARQPANEEEATGDKLPFDSDQPSDKPSVDIVPEQSSEPAPELVAEPAEASAGGTQSADEILKMIRNRK